MAAGTLRSWMVAAWLVVFSNGLFLFVARRFFDRVGAFEGPLLAPAIIVSALIGVAFVVFDSQRPSGLRMRPVHVVPLGAAIFLGAWAALSTFWSLEPDVTLYRGMIYTLMPAMAWVIADLSHAQWRTALAAASGLLIAAGVAAVVVKPEWGTDINDDWRGVMTNRNGFGPICVLGLMAGIALFADGRRRSGSLLSVAAVVALLGTGSRTAWLAGLVGLGVASLVVVARRSHLRRPRPLVTWGAPVALVGGLAAVAGAVAVLWNEPTFAQRRTMWDLLSDHVADAPLNGMGWAAFWAHQEFHTHELLTRGSGHGSVPDLLVGVGVIGLLPWLVVVGFALVGTARDAWRRPDTESWLWFAVITFLVLENLTESYVLWFSYNWIVLIAGALRFASGDGRRMVGTPELVVPFAEEPEVADDVSPVGVGGS